MGADESLPKRGFASMSAERRREIASKGDKSVPADKRAFSLNSALASEAGRKGGHNSPGRAKAYQGQDDPSG
jgi:general stress protein YciG